MLILLHLYLHIDIYIHAHIIFIYMYIGKNRPELSPKAAKYLDRDFSEKWLVHLLIAIGMFYSYSTSYMYMYISSFFRYVCILLFFITFIHVFLTIMCYNYGDWFCKSPFLLSILINIIIIALYMCKFLFICRS